MLSPQLLELLRAWWREGRRRSLLWSLVFITIVQDGPGSDPDQGPLPPGLCKVFCQRAAAGFSPNF